MKRAKGGREGEQGMGRSTSVDSRIGAEGKPAQFARQTGSSSSPLPLGFLDWPQLCLSWASLLAYCEKSLSIKAKQALDHPSPPKGQ